jgi:negative regulator of flagellin synthesis FlgM
MINPLSPSAIPGTGKVGAVSRTAPVSAAKSARTESVDAPNPAADLAALGPPVDPDKVSRIRSAIANGSYTLDVQAIAARMVDFDLRPQS